MRATTTRTSLRARRCHLKGCRIARGHRYVRVVLFPGHELVPRVSLDDPYRRGHPLVIAQCVGCAVYSGGAYLSGGQYGDGYAPDMNACESYCCGVEPCARPLNHPRTFENPDHSCRNCPEEMP